MSRGRRNVPAWLFLCCTQRHREVKPSNILTEISASPLTMEVIPNFKRKMEAYLSEFKKGKNINLCIFCLNQIRSCPSSEKYVRTKLNVIRWLWRSWKKRFVSVTIVFLCRIVHWYCTTSIQLTLRKIAIWLSKNWQKLDIFFKKIAKNCHFFPKKLSMAIFWKKCQVLSLDNFLTVKWQLFEGQFPSSG